MTHSLSLIFHCQSLYFKRHDLYLAVFYLDCQTSNNAICTFFSILSLHIIFISGKWVTKLYTIEKSEAHRKILLIIRFNVLTKKHIPFLFVPILQTDTNIYLDKKRNKKRNQRVLQWEAMRIHLMSK